MTRYLDFTAADKVSNNYFAYYLKYKHFKKELISIKPMYALIENLKKKNSKIVEIKN